jgi:hypothetical protein
MLKLVVEESGFPEYTCKYSTEEERIMKGQNKFKRRRYKEEGRRSKSNY